MVSTSRGYKAPLLSHCQQRGQREHHRRGDGLGPRHRFTTDDEPTVTRETPPKQHETEIRCCIRDPDGYLIEVGC
jgi:hypothetical protein